MHSERYISLLDDLYFYRNTDYIDLEQLYDRMMEDWKALQELWRSRKRNREVADLLFVMARRGYEIVSFLTDKDVTRLISEAELLHMNKSAGYAGDNEDAWINFRVCEGFGISVLDGVIARLGDKYTRYWNVLKNPENNKVNESLVDTMIDFSAYCLILVCLLEETWTK